ncbi:MAG: hypothetical protein MJ227_03010 [Bacilli bacterium]|nr:hypothetical protein [Bacilli bacterium]
MKRKFIKFLSLLALALPMLASCGCGNQQKNYSTGNFEIKFTDAIPIGYVNHVYDFGTIIIQDSGVDYEITAHYYDYTEKVMKPLVITGLTFTPITTSDVAVTVKAHNLDVSKERKTTVKVSVMADKIDELLATGASSFADDGIRKEICIDEQYVKVGNTSIKVLYNGSNFYQWGAAAISPNNFRCLQYWSDKTWDNAILTMWVYNPTNYDFEFQLRIKETPDKGTLDTDWGQTINIVQFAKPNCWTQLFFPMNKLGINRPLFIDEDGTYNDQFIVKTRWLGTPGSPIEPRSYNWIMYVDGVDVVDHSFYPDVDTEPETSLEDRSYGWENLALDTGETVGYGRSKAIYSRSVVHGDRSLSSQKLTFKNSVIQDFNTKYSVMYDPEGEKEADKTFQTPDFSKGTMKADFKFNDSITDRHVTFIAVQHVQGSSEWENAYIIKEITLTDLNDGWYQLYFDFSKVSSFANLTKPIRFGFSFPGVTESNKATAEIYVDNIIYDKNGTGPSPQTDGRGVKIYAGVDETIQLPKRLTVATDVLKLDIKIQGTASEDNLFTLMLFDGNDWDHYFGYFSISMLTTSDAYSGVSTELLSDGYLRVTFTLNAITRINNIDPGTDTAPTSITSIYVRGLYSTGTGYIDIAA